LVLIIEPSESGKMTSLIVIISIASSVLGAGIAAMLAKKNK
jgi:hypothetical protein